MTINDAEIEVVTSSTFPSHGYELGQILYYKGGIDKGFYELTARNPHIWTPIPNPFNVTKDSTEEKYGVCNFNSTTLVGSGLLTDIIPYGSTHSVNGLDSSGTSHSFATGSTQQNAGVAVIRPVGSFAGFTRPAFLPRYKARIVLPARTTNDSRFYSGWITTASNLPLSEAPIVQADGGLVFGYNSTDTNFNVWHGDGTNTITKVQMSPALAVPSSIVGYKIEIRFTSSSSAVISIYNSSTNALLSSATISTNIPASTKTMNWSNCVQNTTATSKTLTMYSLWMRMSQ